MWSDLIFSPLYGYDLANKRIKLVPGGEDAQQTYTASPDSAFYIAYVLTHLAPSRLAWSSFRIEGERKANIETVKTIEAFLGEKVEIDWQDRGKLEEEIRRDGQLGAIPQLLLILWAEGYGAVGENDNALVPGFKPLTVAEALKKFY